jgi:hypothetical protein
VTIEQVLADEHVVYGLYDPREPSRLRYVGVTGDSTRRYLEHARKHDGGRGRRAAWIGSLAADGITVGMRIIRAYPDRHAGRVGEWETVKALRALGQCDLNDPIPPPGGFEPPLTCVGAAAWRERLA